MAKKKLAITREHILFARNVRAFRTTNHLTQDLFAEQCGMSRRMIQMIESGQFNCNFDTIQHVTARMNTTIAEVFSDEYVPAPDSSKNQTA